MPALSRRGCSEVFEVAVDVVLECLLVILPDRDIFRVAQKDASPDVGPDRPQVHDVRAVDAHELLRRKGCLHVLQAEERGDGRSVAEMHPHVLPFAFDIDNVGDTDERDLVVGLDGDVFAVFGGGLRVAVRLGRQPPLAEFVERIGLGGGAAEVELEMSDGETVRLCFDKEAVKAEQSYRVKDRGRGRIFMPFVRQCTNVLPALLQ